MHSLLANCKSEALEAHPCCNDLMLRWPVQCCCGWHLVLKLLRSPPQKW